MTEITYIFLLPFKDDQLFTNVPPPHLDNNMFSYLGKLPQNFLQIIYGCEYYEVAKRKGLQLGYKIIMLYPETPKEFISDLPIYTHTPVVYLLSTNDDSAIKMHCEKLKETIREKDLCILSEAASEKWSINCSKASDHQLVAEWYYKYALQNYSIDYSRSPFSIPLFPSNVYISGNDFAPTTINSQTINSALGNFDSSVHVEEVKKSSHNLVSDGKIQYRQDLITNQLSIIRKLENLVAQRSESVYKEEEYRAPLVISLPYTSIEMRTLPNLEEKFSQFAKLKKDSEKILGSHYDLNYLFPSRSFDLLDINLTNFFINNIFRPRVSFHDFVGMLHSSIKFSPYLRLPLLSKNINSELAFVGIKNLNRLATAKSKNKSIRRAMEAIGKKIAKEALSPTTQDFIKEDAAQIVAITDLPIEWTMIDGIPLGFSHDVCRLPETPITGVLSQYVEQYYFRYSIPQNILQNTLVIFGNDDATFVQAQKPVIELSSKLGFKTKLCLSKESFFQTIIEEDPDLLIIDTHGDVDINTHESFLFVGDEKITGDDVVRSRIKPRLVFLSACNTFTTYNTVATIANSFFEVGSLAVTTSYMPLEIIPATNLYYRLLNNLAFAATHDIHKNWLSFISHLLRTSYIHSPIGSASKYDEFNITTKNEALIMLSTESMLFDKRREIYQKLNDHAFTKSLNANYEYVIPHYLMYSTLGRADMIQFSISSNHVGIDMKQQERE